MSFVQKLREYHDKPGKGVAQSPPVKGFKRFAFVLLTYFWKLVQLNMLFLLVSVPIITLPAAYCALSRVVVNLFRSGIGFVWTDFWKEFKQSFGKSLILGLIGCVGFGLLALIIHTQNISTTLGYTLNVIGILIFLFTILLLDYAFLMLCFIDLRMADIIRNSILLVLKERKRNLLLIIIPNALFALLYIFFPFTLWIFVLCYFSINQLIICTIAIEPIKLNVLKE